MDIKDFESGLNPQAVIDRAQEVAKEAGVEVTTPFDLEAGITEQETLGLAVWKSQGLRYVVLTVLPLLSALINDAAGLRYVWECVTERMLLSVKAAIRKGDTVPRTVLEFLSFGRRYSEKGWRAVRAHVNETLRKGNIHVNFGELAQCLASAAFASQMFPKVKQENWIAVIAYAKAQVTANNLEPGILDLWLATRDAAIAGSEEEGDFSAFSSDTSQ